VALEAQFAVDAIDLEPHEGVTTINYPMSPSSFGEHFEHSRRQAAEWLVKTLAVVRAGSFAEIRGGQTGWDPEARDLERIKSWREAMVPYYGADGWTRVYAESFRALKSWYARPEVRLVFREVAPVIARQQHLTSQAILALYQHSGASTCPAPFFGEPILPRYQPAAVSIAPVTPMRARRRVAAQTTASTPGTPGEPRKPANFGRNPDGTPRASFTSEELACAQAIMQSAARRHAQS
jgi:hypothetical protein